MPPGLPVRTERRPHARVDCQACECQDQPSCLARRRPRPVRRVRQRLRARACPVQPRRDPRSLPAGRLGSLSRGAGASLGEHPGQRPAHRRQRRRTARALPVDGIPDGPRARQRAGGAGPGARAAARAGTRPASSWATCSSARPTPRWATAAWAAWPPASSTPSPSWACPRSATACATATACSRSASRTAGRSRCPTTGCGTAMPGTWPRPEVRYSVGFGGRVVTEGGARRWLPAERMHGRRPSTSSCPATTASACRRCASGRRRAEQPIDFAAFCRGDHVAGGAPPRGRRRAELGAVSRRQHAGRARTAAEAGVFLVSASLQDMHRPPPARARQPGRPRPAQRHPPERHPSGAGAGRTDAPADRRARPGLGRGLDASPARRCPTPTTR